MEDSKSAALIMDDLRNYLRDENGDIFEIIKRAIMVAASDQSTEFQSRRHQIAQILFSDELIKHYVGDKCKKQNPKVSHETEDERKSVSEGLSTSVLCNEEVREWNENDSHGKPTMKKQTVPTCKKQPPTMVMKLGLNTETKFQIQKDPVTPEENVNDLGGSVYNDRVAEVLKMKKILDKSGDESQSELVVCALLAKLQSMELSMETLEETMIGKTVSALQKHASGKVRQSAVTLVKAWKRTVDEWVENESNVEEPKSLQLKSTNVNMNSEKKQSNVVEPKSLQIKSMNVNMNSEMKLGGPEKAPKIGIDRTVYSWQKLEAIKRKMREEYERIENMKKKSRIQVIELDAVTKKAPRPHAHGEYNRRKVYRRG
ncbi:hypothetical protein Lser_V15G39926 [Lactuca serriola]